MDITIKKVVEARYLTTELSYVGWCLTWSLSLCSPIEKMAGLIMGLPF
ncbi:hypothetical protein [Sutcliffiella halmapala]|nr:hypothetical protein [Sutcliffiella halmapala]